VSDLDDVLMSEVKDQLIESNNGDEELAHEILMDLKSEGYFDLPLDLQEFPDDELGTMPLW
jgi:hypothetical protein